ncbi:MAG: orotidine-5'-phosphate decarboxylase [Nitrospinales bacterium]
MNEDCLKRARERIVFALDVPSLHEALRYVRMLEGWVGCFKVGLELFASEGPRVLRAIEENSSAEIFLDLKLHDIPATVRGTIRAVSKYRVRYLTVHCEHDRQLAEACAGLEGGPRILAVTVLTSIGERDLRPMGFQNGLTLQQLVLDRAEMAKRAGCFGVVCSGHEVAAVKKTCGPDFAAVVPGIRPRWNRISGDDQARAMTPEEAISLGADLIVVGRPIRAAADPEGAAKKVVEEVQAALAPNPGP